MGDLNVRQLEDVSSNGSPIYTLFDAERTTDLDGGHLLRLASGVLGAVLVEGFAPAELCAAVMKGLDDHPLGAYDEAVVFPPVAKLGPAAYDFYGARELNAEYWGNAEQARAIRSTLLDGADPLEYAVDRFRSVWPGPVAPASCAGRPLFAGMIREVTTGMKMHWDEIVRELPGALDEEPVAQLAFNWYLSMPERGGDTQVYKRRWSPADEDHRDGYGWAERMVEREPTAAVRPAAGDAVLFDPRNYHLVRPCAGEGRRVSLSFFLGVTASGRLLYWS
ncbi:2OG-Fe(II) oxygenase [Kitasatospora sp. NPDC048545]|uniref:2OG-Fe(II)-dependent halogenase WelO5 family protein n=1 Tax=Kitasatospora sp. NPDC048545 TaxID=3157208 RepID=UPI003410825C